MGKLNDFVNNNRKYLTKIGIDLIAIFILGIPILVLFVVGKPFKRGFNCDDESIRYPYKDNTISSGLNYAYSTTIPIITIIIVEIVYHVQRIKNGRRNKLNSEIISDNTETTKCDLYWQIYCRLAPFAFGAVISQMTTDIAKYSIGRLRPHFIDVCQPKYKDFTFRLDNPKVCLESTFEFQYITDFECSNPDFDDHSKKDARLSFMSGHSSFASYCLIYLVIYLQVRLKWTTIGFVRPLYQALLIYLVIYTGFSRISDYKHHWSDVLTGLIQGTLVALLTTYFISDLFVKNGNNDSNNSYKSEIQGSSNPNYNSCRVEMNESITDASYK